MYDARCCAEMAPDPPRKKVTNRDTQRANDQYRRGEDWYDGMWRSGGTGMITFYYSDFLASGIASFCPLTIEHFQAVPQILAVIQYLSSHEIPC